jgi:hypothetical protein
LGWAPKSSLHTPFLLAQQLSPHPAWCDHYLPIPYRRSLAHLPSAPISTTALPPSTPDLHRWVDSPLRNSGAASSPLRGCCLDAPRAFISFVSWSLCRGCEEESFNPITCGSHMSLSANLDLGTFIWEMLLE